MKDLIIYGAFDRYNYGDNLMPLLFELYLNRSYSHLLDEYHIKFAAINKSDLSRYGCLKTEKFTSVVKSANRGSVIVIIGGEVVGSTKESLLLHSFENPLIYKIVARLKWDYPKIYNIVSRVLFHNVAPYPYMPCIKDIPNIFNTVGGRFVGEKNTENQMYRSLKNSLFISTRDRRTQDSMKSFVEARIAPDSVFIISSLISDEFLCSKIQSELISLKNEQYAVFQCSPLKIQEDHQAISQAIKLIYEKFGTKVILLPIGYASGHDDFDILSEIHELLPNETRLLYQLTVWEIMYVIKQSSMFYGTSLHGIITAMAFAVPHFAINPSIEKLKAFIEDWTVAPFNKAIKLNEVKKTLYEVYDADELKSNSTRLSELVDEHYTSLLSKL